ncbi:MAG: hypothetical protein E4G74_00045 [Erysipelotrichales bacterium]|nr:MAG: hypothetical protein E4G74_00045 [Erysipelotrichales bacterium]
MTMYWRGLCISGWRWVKTAEGKFASNSKRFRRFLEKLWNSGDVRDEDASFLLDLLESGCSREETEAALKIDLHAPISLRRYIQRSRLPLFKQCETKFGFRFALLLCLRLRLRKATERNSLLHTLAYPTLLLSSGYCVSAMYLFVLSPTFEANRSLFADASANNTPLYQMLFIAISFSLVIATFFLQRSLAKNPYRIYVYIRKLLPVNIWSISLSRRMAFLIAEFYTLGLSTRENYHEIASFPHEPVMAEIASQITEELSNGIPPHSSLNMLDPFLVRIISIETHSDFMKRLQDYQRITQKRYDYALKKAGYLMTICAYVFITILIIMMYQKIMIPLEMLKNMG